MADYRITKQRIKNHWHYGWWKYVLMAVLTAFSVNLIFAMTAYRAPEEKKIEIYLCSGWANAEQMQEDLWPAILEIAPDQEDFQVRNIDLTDDSNVYASVQFTTYIAAQEGDLCLLPNSEMKKLAGEEEMYTAFVDLSPYMERGALDVKGIDLSGVTYVNEAGEMVPFAIPADTLYGLTEYGIDPADSVLVAMAYSGNEENVVRTMNLFVERFLTEKPEYYDAWHEQRNSQQTGSSQIFN